MYSTVNIGLLNLLQCIVVLYLCSYLYPVHTITITATIAIVIAVIRTQRTQQVLT